MELNQKPTKRVKVQSFEDERLIKTRIDEAVNKGGSSNGNESGTKVNDVM